MKFESNFDSRIFGIEDIVEVQTIWDPVREEFALLWHKFPDVMRGREHIYESPNMTVSSVRIPAIYSDTLCTPGTKTQYDSDIIIGTNADTYFDLVTHTLPLLKHQNWDCSGGVSTFERDVVEINAKNLRVTIGKTNRDACVVFYHYIDSLEASEINLPGGTTIHFTSSEVEPYTQYNLTMPYRDITFSGSQFSIVKFGGQFLAYDLFEFLRETMEMLGDVLD